jgi:hypothetical protein
MKIIKFVKRKGNIRTIERCTERKRKKEMRALLGLI